MVIFAALFLHLGFSGIDKSGVQAFLAFHQNVLAVKTGTGWHDPTAGSRFSKKSFPVVVAGIGKPIDGRGTVAVSKDKDWGWIADPDQGLPAEQVFCWGVLPRYPRKVTETGDPRGVYHSAAIAAYKAKGLAIDHIEAMQVYRVDLRGDGNEEVLVAAQGRGKFNSMSIVLLRQPTANGVKTDILESQEMGYPRVAAIADFCGDGTMQIVVAGGISDGIMASFWSIKSQKPKRLASFVWGD